MKPNGSDLRRRLRASACHIALACCCIASRGPTLAAATPDRQAERAAQHRDPAPATPHEKPSLTAPATDDEIASLVHDLGDASYAKRTAATRRLCAIGMRAADRLRAAASSDAYETALRASAILKILHDRLFAGVTVELACSASRVAWHEPIDVTVTVTNRSPYPTWVPFELDAARRRRVGSDAVRVGDVLDVADWLVVRDGHGDPVALRVDDITVDAAVSSAVETRAADDGPMSRLSPGRSATLTLNALNRGWARYPLLNRGVYTIVFDYTPAWSDDVLRAERVGRVVSNELRVSVTTGAPDAVSRHGVEATVSIRRDGPALTAALTNHSDVALVVNTHFGLSPPFAEGRWVCRRGRTVREVAALVPPHASWDDFQASRLVTVQPGDTIDVARIDIAELREGIAELRERVAANPAEQPPRDWTVSFRYDNMCDRRWQAKQRAARTDDARVPAFFQRPLPRRLLTARHTSNELVLPAGD
ncbi:MAG: hypothetical protein ACE5E6_07110 [Phycisphaerae bacterium]